MSFMNEWKERYQKVVEEYGKAAFATYAVLFVGTLLGFWLAIRSGIEVQGAAAGAGTIGGAYVATKLTQPLRIVLTVVITPIAVGLWHRVRRTSRLPVVPPPPVSPPAP